MSALAISAALGAAGLLSNLHSNSQNAAQNQKALEQSRYQYEDSKIYNSAQMQVARLRAAGVNPALAFGKDAGMAQTQSVPSQIPMQSLDLGGLASIASGIANNDVNRARTLSEQRLNMIKADSQEFDLMLDRLFSQKERSANLGHTLADISKLYQMVLLYKEEGKTQQAKQSYYAFQSALSDALAQLHGKERELIEKQLQWYDVKASKDLEVASSEVSRNYASASESRSNAALTSLVTSIRSATSSYEIVKAIDDAANSDIAVQIGQNNLRAARAAAEQAEYASSNKEAVFWKDFVLDCLNGAVSVADVKSRLMSSKAFQGMSENGKKRVQNQAEDIAKRYELGKESNEIKRAEKSVRSWSYDWQGKPHLKGQTDYKTH